MGKLFKWLWEYICQFDAVVSILERLGWKESVLVIAGSTGASIATALVGQPWWVNILSGFGAAFLVLVGVVCFKRAFSKNSAILKGLNIEYIQERAISIGAHVGHGPNNGPWLVAQVCLANNDHRPYHHIKVSIASLTGHDGGVPDDLKRRLPRQIYLKFSNAKDELPVLNPSDREIIDIFFYHQTFYNPNIRVASQDGPEIYGGTYAIQVKATSQEGISEIPEFIVGLCRRPQGSCDLRFEPVWEPGITDQDLRDRLIALREEGVYLRNESLPSLGMVDVWRDRFEFWHLSVLQTANRLNFRHQLWPLNVVQSWNLGSPFNGEHQQSLNIISEIIFRVEKYLKTSS